MKFTSTLLALASIGAASAAKCASSQYAGDASADVEGNVKQAIGIFCASPAGHDQDIELVSGREGYSLHFSAGDLNVKFFASGPRTKFSNCEAAINDIATTCTSQWSKYGRTTTGGEYYSITVLKGNSNDVWI